MPPNDARLVWITPDDLDVYDLGWAMRPAFDAAPVPVKRRRCVTHDALDHEGGYCIKAYIGFGPPAYYAKPCRFVTEYAVPAPGGDHA